MKLNDSLAGISSGRVFSHYYRKMLSLALLEAEWAKVGDTVEVLWGSPGTRQKRIKATVARYPYLDLPKNSEIDTHELP